MGAVECNQALIVCCHPEPSSFTHAMARTAVGQLEDAGWSVELSDLYAEGFDPVAGRHDFTTCADPARFHYQSEQALAAAERGFSPEIAREQARVARAKLLIFVFPLWWGGMPAMLKGWFDRVLAYGFAYEDGRRFSTGMMPDKTAMLCVTTGGTAQRFSAGDAYGPIEDVLRPVTHCMLRYLGMTVFDTYAAFATPRVSESEREEMLRELGEAIDCAIAKFA